MEQYFLSLDELQFSRRGNREILVRRITQSFVIIIPNLEYVTRSNIDLSSNLYK